MAIINGQVPTIERLPVDYKRRVVIKFRPNVRLTYSAAAHAEIATAARREWAELTAAHPGIALVPYFSSLPESTLRGPGFTQYFAIECPPGVEPETVARAVASWPNVETAYVEAGPTPPPVNPSDDPRNSNQQYEDAAPTGIDVRYAWGSADGSGVGFVDMERGWTLNHEDLAAAGITLISGVNTDYTGHGTAVLGEVVMVDNAIGGVGIAPRASARVVSQWRNATTYNTAEAILSAANVMQSGDVLLLEAQTTSSTMGGYLPVEVEQATFDAIQYATSNGIIVVEAGGNGSNNLDNYKDANGKAILNRGSADFRDSGAIIVGAATSTAPHSRLSFSNYGSRVDCYGWGQNIDTTGDGWTGNATNTYTSSFGGTSGASPIIAGCCLIVQSWLIGHGNSRYSPSSMRSLLSDAKLNTPSANPSTDLIGVMPNLQAVISSRRNRWWWIYNLAWAWMILLGALLITPGGVLCIACGPADPGYIGNVLVNVLGIGAIALGVISFVRRGQVAAR
ncbi:MAG TPA: S8 family peptidase [Vicinamibacterales bacterium]|nr:S8 family peptidase [Vicinamibacterales bacterium]